MVATIQEFHRPHTGGLQSESGRGTLKVARGHASGSTPVPYRRNAVAVLGTVRKILHTWPRRTRAVQMSTDLELLLNPVCNAAMMA